MDKFKLIIQAEDGRTIERLFDSMEELEDFKKTAVEMSGAVMEKISEFFESPGLPSVEVWEEKN